MNLNEWIIKGEVGTSSKTIWAVLSGIETKERKLDTFEGYDIPHDPDDFRRCYLFIRNCNLKTRLSEVIKIFPAWRPYIENWDKLEEMLIEQIKTQKPNGMYEFMQELKRESRLIDGWVEKSSGSWVRED
jgi:hypothetical protein